MNFKSPRQFRSTGLSVSCLCCTWACARLRYWWSWTWSLCFSRALFQWRRLWLSRSFVRFDKRAVSPTHCAIFSFQGTFLSFLGLDCVWLSSIFSIHLSSTFSIHLSTSFLQLGLFWVLKQCSALSFNLAIGLGPKRGRFPMLPMMISNTILTTTITTTTIVRLKAE